MKTRAIAIAVAAVITVMVMSVLFLNGREVHASSVSSVAVDNLFTALDVNDSATAGNAFAEGAVVHNRVTNEMYSGPDEIAVMLESWMKEGRQHDVYVKETINVTSGLDLVVSDVDISDHGVAWGRETIIALVYKGQILRLDVTDFQLTLH